MKVPFNKPKMDMQKMTVAFTFQNIDQLKMEYSKPFNFRDIQWRIQIQRVNNYYRVFLHCGKDGKGDTASNWLINASVSFRLIPFSFGRYPQPNRYERSLGAIKFYGQRTNCGISNFISVDDLNNTSKQLVQHNCIKIEVEINADTQEIVATKRSPDVLASVDIKERCYRFQVANVSEMSAMVFAPFFLADIPWQFVVSKYTNVDNESLGCHLSIDQDQFKVEDQFKCDVSVQYTLLSKNAMMSNAVGDFQALNSANSYSLPVKQLIALKDLFDEKNGFWSGDAIQVDARILVKLPSVYSEQNAKRSKISCPVCFDDMQIDNMYTTECGHIFCGQCIINPVKLKKKCSICGRIVMPMKSHQIFLP